MEEGEERSLRRSASLSQMDMGSFSRARTRTTCTSFEQDKDCIAIWLNSLDSMQISKILDGIIKRCNLNHLTFLWTVLESVPHHEFIYHLRRQFPSIPFHTLSTPVSRHLKEKFEISRRKENKILFRADSLVISSDVTKTIASQLLNGPLPELRPSTAPQLEYGTRKGYRLITPTRRHMEGPIGRVGTPSCYRIVSATHTARTPPPGAPHIRTRSTSNSPRPPSNVPSPRTSAPYPLSPHFPGQTDVPLLSFFSWFSSLQKDWQQKDILHLIVWCLEERELYYLTTLLLSCQYRDFISDLPVDIVRHILSYVPSKDLLLVCRVSRVWNERCSCNRLWKYKCSNVSLGVSVLGSPSWKRLYISDIKLKRNWRLGRSVGWSLGSHSHRVLSVCIKEDTLCSGSSDQTIRVWSLKDGKLLNTIYTNSKNIWCLSFYGLNFILSGSGDSSVRIWNYRTGVCERQLQGHTGTVWSLARKKDVLLTGSHDKTAIVWNIRHCKHVSVLVGHTGAIFSVDLNESTTEAYTASGDKTLRIWNISTADPECTRIINISTHQPVMSLSYSGGMLACSAGSSVSLWSVATGDKLIDFKGHHDRVESVHLLTDGPNINTIISGGRDGLIKYWNINSGRCIRTLRNKPGSIINDVSRDSSCVAYACDDHTVQVLHFEPNIVSQHYQRDKGTVRSSRRTVSSLKKGTNSPFSKRKTNH